MGDYQVLYGNLPIIFSVRFRTNLVEKVAIHVHPDQRVVVDAPVRTSMSDIKIALLKRARWVSSQLSKQGEIHRHSLPRQYVSGETHWYLGKRYLLKVKLNKLDDIEVKLRRGMLIVSVSTQSARAVKAALDEWYFAKARQVFTRRLDAIYPKFRWLKQPPQWRVRSMKKQWGSCSPNGRLSLNPMLVKAPNECIDYVLTHELCHLKIHNHSEAFYQLLTQHLPDWRATKTRLDNFSEVFLT